MNPIRPFETYKLESERTIREKFGFFEIIKQQYEMEKRRTEMKKKAYIQNNKIK